MATSKQPIQWAWIEEQWQKGRLTTRAIAKAHKEEFDTTVAESAIRKRASQYGWQKDLSETIQRETRRKLAEGSLPEEVRKSAQGSAHFDIVDREVAIVESASDEAVQVVLRHRQQAAQLHALTDQAAFYVNAKLKIYEDGSPFFEYEPGELKDVLNSLSAVGTNRVRAIEIERKAYGLDEPDQGNRDDVPMTGYEIFPPGTRPTQ